MKNRRQGARGLGSTRTLGGSLVKGTALTLGVGLGLAANRVLADVPLRFTPSQGPSAEDRAVTRRALVVIDARVPHHASLAEAARARADVLMLDGREDPIAAIGAALSRRRAGEVHVIAHGGPGYVELAGRIYGARELGARGAELGQWFETAPYERWPDLLVYGCDVARGTRGEAFVEALAELTGADVAASTDRTGGDVAGGNWLLEATVGTVEAELPFPREVAEEYRGSLDVFAVTNLDDDGVGSLRAAIQAANGTAGDDVIIFTTAAGCGDAGAVPSSCATDGTLTGTIELSSGTLSVNANYDVTILGPGAGALTIDAAGTSGVLLVTEGAGLDLSGVTLTGGSSESGGALFTNSSGDVILTDVHITGNQAGNGGAIYAAWSEGGGSLSLDRCVVSGNTAFFGGAIMSRYFGSIDLHETVVSGNEAEDGIGGGIWSLYTSDVTVRSSTFSGNTAGIGGAIYVQGTELLAVNSTISGNTAKYGGGVILDGFVTGAIVQSTITDNTSTFTEQPFAGGISAWWSYGEFVVAGTIVQGNHGTVADADGGTSTVPFDIEGYDSGETVFTLVSSVIGVSEGTFEVSDDPQLANQLDVDDAGLGPLADNGGPTETHALLEGSPAVDEGPSADLLGFLAITTGLDPLATDQRGAGFPRVRGDAVDVGAFEFTPDEPTPDGGVGGGAGGGGGMAGGDDGCGCAVVGASASAGDPSAPTRMGLLAGLGAAFVAWRSRRRAARKDVAE